MSFRKNDKGEYTKMDGEGGCHTVADSSKLNGKRKGSIQCSPELLDNEETLLQFVMGHELARRLLAGRHIEKSVVVTKRHLVNFVTVTK